MPRSSLLLVGGPCEGHVVGGGVWSVLGGSQAGHFVLHWGEEKTGGDFCNYVMCLFFWEGWYLKHILDCGE